MKTLNELSRRMAALAPERAPDGLSESEITVRNMSDEEIERRAREILGGNTDHLDPDLVQQARHISERRARS